MSDKASYSSTKVPTTVTAYDDGFSDSAPTADAVAEVEIADANIPEAAKAVALDAGSLGDVAVPAGVETSALTAPEVSASSAPAVGI